MRRRPQDRFRSAEVAARPGRHRLQGFIAVAGLVVAVVGLFGLAYAQAGLEESQGQGAVSQGEAEAMRPHVVSAGTADGHLTYNVQEFYVTNSGRTAITISSIEVLRFPFVFIEAGTSPTAVSLGVIDYVALLRSQGGRAGADPLYMKSLDTCGTASATVEPGGKPVLFAAFSGSVRGPGGNYLISAPRILPAKAVPFSVRVNYFNAPSQTVEVEPERESAELASLRDGFRQLVDACAPKLGEQEITVPTGFAYEHFALSAESGPTDLRLSRF